jgi:hypothetical protein
MARLFTDEELARLARSPRRQLVDALDAGDPVALGTCAAALERSFVGTVVGTRNWIAHTFGFAARHDDGSLLAGLVDATRHAFAVLPGPLDAFDAAAPSIVADVLDHAARGDHVGALSEFDALEARTRAAQDTLRDWLSALLSHVYREHGVEVLELALRHTARRTLFDWMPTDMARPPEKRLPSWVRMLHGHFSELRLDEDDEKFTIVQDPCGTCARQIEQGRYDPPLSLAVVTERHATTWFRGDTPIYRAHVPLWHVTLARELAGVPWPVNRCPAGLGTGPCAVLLYKDPLDPRAEEQVPTGSPIDTTATRAKGSTGQH